MPTIINFLVLACVFAMLAVLGPVAGVPVSELRRHVRRDAVRKAQRRLFDPYPASLVRFHFWLTRQAYIAKRELKYDAISLCARALAVYSAVYCWLTRTEGYEGLTMSYWRWTATVHLALKERTQRRTAVAFGDRLYHGSAGPQVMHNGVWRPVPAGGAGITRTAQISPLYFSKVAGGLPVIQDLSVFPGNIFFVDSGTTVQGGDTAGFGYHPDKPFLTVDFAIGQCTASQADFIFALPGHYEDIASGETIDLDIQGASVVGVGRGPDRPEFVYDHASSTWDVGAHATMIKNCIFQPSVTVVTLGLDIETTITDVVLEDLEVIPGEAGDGTDEFQTFLETKATCTRTIIKGFLYSAHASCGGITEAIHINGVSDRVHIEDFWIEADGAALVAGIVITGSATRALIESGVITMDAEPGIEVASGSPTGLIRDVTIFSNLATIDAATVALLFAHDNVKYIEVGNEADTQVKTPSVDD